MKNSMFKPPSGGFRGLLIQRINASAIQMKLFRIENKWIICRGEIAESDTVS